MVDYPKDWEKTQLINILSIKKGKQKNSNEISSWAKYPHINGGIEESGYTFEWNTHPDTITISEGGNSCGFVNFQKRKFWAGGHCYVVLPDNRFVDTEFLYYLLKSHQNNLMSLRVGSGLPNIQSKSLLEYEVNLTHNKMEQKAIAETLMTLDRHVENLESLIEKKKMIRDGALEDLITGKTRIDGFEDEWEEVRFNDVIVPKARIGWQGLKKDEYLQSGYSYLISGTDFNQGTISFSKISYVTKERYDLDINIQVNSGDVLVTKDGTIGKVAIVPRIDRKATLNSGVFVFKTNKKLTRNFLYWILRSSIFEKFIDDLSAGSTIKHLYQKDLKKFSFYIPKDMNEQKVISSILKSIDDDIQNLKKEKEKIEKIKAGAMDDLLTGKVRLI